MRRLATSLAAREWRIGVWSTTASDESTWRGALPPRDSDSSVDVRRFPVARFRRPLLFHQLSRAFFRLPSAVRPEAAWMKLQGPYSPALVDALGSRIEAATLFTPYLYYPTVYGMRAVPGLRLLIPAAHDEAPLRLGMVRECVQRSDGIWYHSAEERDLLERVHPDALTKPCAVGTMGIDDQLPGDAGRFRARYGVSDPFVLYAGRTTSGKGYEDLLAGFRRLRLRRNDVLLVLTGGGSDAAEPNVRSLGFLDEGSLRDAVSAAAAVAVPSSMESLSMIALEAWAAGRPCIVNAGSPVLRAQAERSGGALTFADAAGFAHAVARIIDQPELAQRLGESGRAYVMANYMWDGVAGRLTELLAEATARRSHAAH